ncbi:hypothetical protein FOXG_20805 [Fusarium oxysporum f. sp. lycopersici 4287]|uniref:Uncharacterized protein n=1 Tax=Fusarium oxysporum f. sp. lycopersici (strain 4287 / CBS 123668 / FGSC 9935 / NRRL 34936) TaxID=426428 RepID=A0A0J9VR19_FUSO4|nr:hypothetical protein FOXG_20805 [Fusarium oxysporum f. sp. lycopersici 4287]KNB13348.1 hypothetical protein FOXG_20805 [Fusarium oxysporum f. sp. lycopersici 4287]
MAYIYENFLAYVPGLDLNYLIFLDQGLVMSQTLIEEELLFDFASIDDFISGWTGGL